MKAFDKITQLLLVKSTKYLLSVECIESRKEAGSFFFNAVLLKNEKGKVTAQHKITSYSTDKLNDWIKEFAPPNTSVIVNYNSDKVINKVVDEFVDIAILLKEIIPDVDQINLYCQILRLSEKKTFVSIVRKNIIDNVLDAVSFIKDNVISVSIGPIFIMDTYQYLFSPDNDKRYDIKFENYWFHIADNNILDFKINSYSSDISEDFFILQDERISSKNVMAYSFGLSYLASPLSVASISVPQIYNNEMEYKYRNLSRIYAIGLICVVLVMLMISTLVFNSYQSKYRILENNVSELSAHWEKYHVILEKEKKKEELLKKSGLIEESNVAYYADQITSELPDSLYLRRMYVHPVNKKAISDNIDFLSDKISIEGNCYSSADLSEWISKLKSYDWIKSILVKDYKQEDYFGAFTIEITKKHEN